MYYLDAPWHRWGWYVIARGQVNCGLGHPERHDVDGDGSPDTLLSETHCLATGTYDISVDTLVWDSSGSSVTGWGTLYRRRVTMLGALGSFVSDTTSPTYIDVRVTLDRGKSDEFALSGDVRAGDYFLPDGDQLYPPGRSFTIYAGDTLWFQPTYVGGGPDGRTWYGDPAAILTQLAFDFRRHPNTWTGGINSAPGLETSPAQRRYLAGVQPWLVVGRAVAPHHLAMDSGEVRLSDSIRVTTCSSERASR
jgi:hypothetical protein